MDKKIIKELELEKKKKKSIKYSVRQTDRQLLK